MSTVSPSSESLSPATPRFSSGLVWVLRLLCTIALGVSGYLAWTAFNSVEVYGCGGDVFDCGHVLTSGWSRWFGIPVSMPAFALYASLLAVLVFIRKDAPDQVLRAGWRIMQSGSLMAALAALWFIGLQIFVIRHLCIYCLAAHTCGLLLAALIFWYQPGGVLRRSLLPIVPGILGLAVLIAGQFLGPAPQTFVVEHFEDEPTIVETDGLAQTDTESDFFAAPGEDGLPGDAADESTEVFASPEIFAAPEVTVELVTPETTNSDASGSQLAAPGVPSPQKEASLANAAGAIIEEKSDGTDALEAPAKPVPTVEETDGKVKSDSEDSAEAEKGIAPSGGAGQKAANSQSEVTNSKSPRVAVGTLLFFSPGASSTIQLLSLFQEASAQSSGSPVGDSKTAGEQPTSDNAKSSDQSSPAAEDATAAKEEVQPKQDAQPAAEKPEPRIVTAAGGKFRLNAAQWPLLGNADAKYIIVEMFDYTCPHCRNTHRTIKDALKKYGDDLAVIALAVPLNPACNSTSQTSNAQNIDACELARLSVAVWRVSPKQFSEFHSWLFDGGRNRTAAEARRQAEQLVGKEALVKELNQKTASEYISRHVELYRRVGSGSVPKLLFPKSTMTGEVGSVSAISQAIDREFAQ